MPSVIDLLPAALAFLVAAAAPGPAVLAVATVSMRTGRRTGLRFALGLAFGLAFWGLVAATGLGAVLVSSAQALTFMKVIGGLYLLWLAVGSARSAVREASAQSTYQTVSTGFRQGLLLNLSNPKAVFAWMAVLAIGTDPQDAGGTLILATAICVMLGLAIYTIYAWVFSTSGAMAAYQRARRWIDACVAGVFAIAGLGLIRSALVR